MDAKKNTSTGRSKCGNKLGGPDEIFDHKLHHPLHPLPSTPDVMQRGVLVPTRAPLVPVVAGYNRYILDSIHRL